VPSYFPYNLGYCQSGTPFAFDGAAMDHRNILYFQVSMICHIFSSQPEPLSMMQALTSLRMP
jgi:hypothetical protein